MIEIGGAGEVVGLATTSPAPKRNGVWFAAWIAPVALLAVYVFTVAWVLDETQLPQFHSETGLVEILTALVCAGAVIMGLIITCRLRDAPRRYRLWFALFTLGALFILLEEISYGQHYLGWTSPAYFEEYNKQAETNLHNLYGDWLSSLLRRVVNTMLPLTAIALPWFFTTVEKQRLRGEAQNLPRLLRDAYQPGHWTWFLLPRWELVLWVVLAGLLTPIRKAFGFSDGYWSGSLSEVKELMWGCTLLVYTLTLHHRLIASRPSPAPAAPSGSAAQASA